MAGADDNIYIRVFPFDVPVANRHGKPDAGIIIRNGTVPMLAVCSGRGFACQIKGICSRAAVKQPAEDQPEDMLKAI